MSKSIFLFTCTVIFSSLLTVVGALLFWPVSSEAKIPLPASGAVEGPTVHALIDSYKDELIVLDVRTPGEFATGHVPGAINIAVNELSARSTEVPLDKHVLIVCRTGSRAGVAYGILEPLRSASGKGLWYAKSTPVYSPDGNYLFP